MHAEREAEREELLRRLSEREAELQQLRQRELDEMRHDHEVVVHQIHTENAAEASKLNEEIDDLRANLTNLQERFDRGSRGRRTFVKCRRWSST